MNDNLRHHMLRQDAYNPSREAWLLRIQDVRDIGIRAITQPESLTMGEIQDIAWGYLMAASFLEGMATAEQ